MESIRRKNTRYRVMPYAYGDYILTCGEIPYQSFGLDKKRTKRLLRSFFGGEREIHELGGRQSLPLHGFSYGSEGRTRPLREAVADGAEALGASRGLTPCKG